ncbi:hypothetical protein PL75_07525 [Neisseria arctica]|uniref:Copper chaperone PCu(A)C n=1 Tax=Neisseria arctica TaxID=1470200 RepID=A0A0J1C2Q3_9NEIS|nr:copper chaperone PCu(A)C [Neisseria arctica]KLT72548.1 hypothetical protein PL75_07525 [Neisseria arctica]UOO87601.1 copper chaperone PCu(A)C [Neisseria arctica]
MKKLLAALALAGMFQTTSAAGIEIDDAWARTTVQGMSMGGVFMDIENDGKTDDVLTGGSTPVAEKVEIHTHVNDNGVMRMREVEGGLALPKGGEVKLKPGGYHVMLMGLKAPLQAGQKFPLTLNFKNAKSQTVTVEVKNPAASQNTQKQHGAHHH